MGVRSEAIQRFKTVEPTDPVEFREYGGDRCYPGRGLMISHEGVHFDTDQGVAPGALLVLMLGRGEDNELFVRVVSVDSRAREGFHVCGRIECRTADA